MQNTPDTAAEQAAIDALVQDSGSYELLKKRLHDLGLTLRQHAQALNEARLAAFGRSEQALILRTRARTDNNCVARDIVRIGELLLFGYNVFIGLRKETSVGDVFGLYRLVEPQAEDGAAAAEELELIPLAGSFLDDPRFAADFRELYAYYKHATLLQLRVTQDKLLAAFQIGQQLHDVRVFRWEIDRDGRVRYVDNRGERDIALPPSHDFEWTVATREHHVDGPHPHVNVLDAVFVETVGGDLTVKVENNTETGLGIYSEPVEDAHQSLTDAEIAYAKVGMLILLKVRPYREQTTRYLVFNQRTQQVERIDAVGVSCVQLPEDHGIIFPGGYCLQSGEYKRFDLPPERVAGLRFKRLVRSPNGEDVLVVFYQPDSGHYALFTYNLINKTLGAPIVCNGYARFPDGRLLVFQADSEPTRLHAMQLWRTPFATEDHASAQPPATGFFGRVGNAELVRGVSDLMGIARAVREQAPSRAAYEDLVRQCGRVLDGYFWLDAPEASGLVGLVKEITGGAAVTLAEFEKVDAIRRETARALAQAQAQHRTLLTDLASTLWRSPEDFMNALVRLREGRGRLQLLKDLRYVDMAGVQAMDAELVAEQQRVGERALQFLTQPTAFDAPRHQLDALAAELPQASTSPALDTLLRTLDSQAAGLDLLTEQLASLPGGDAVTRTAILDKVSLLYADINALRADARRQRKSLGRAEAQAEFGAQFKLFGQAVENALAFADTPDKCDEALTRLLAQLEELEGRFAEHEEFLADISAKREAVYEAMAARRQSLVEALQRRAQGLAEAAGRILEGIPRRTSQFKDLAEVHAFFAADPLLAKLRKLGEDLRGLGATVQADDLATRLKAAHDQALRAVRDQRELSADDGQGLKLGHHVFTVNRQPIDLTLVQHGQGQAFHITGTDYLAPVQDDELEALRDVWDQALVSETEALSRAEYLAGQLLKDWRSGQGELAWSQVQALLLEDPLHPALMEQVRRAAGTRYQEGYQKGVHDEDALRILSALASMQDAAGLLAWGAPERALALRFWLQALDDPARLSLTRRARAALQMRTLFTQDASLQTLESALALQLARFLREPDGQLEAQAVAGGASAMASQAAAYLVQQIAQNSPSWVISGPGEDLAQALLHEMERHGHLPDFRHDLDSAEAVERWALARDWVQAFAATQLASAQDWIDDAASLLAFPVPRTRHNATLHAEVDGLRGEHPRLHSGTLRLNLNDFWRRFDHHHTHVVPRFQALQRRRQQLVAAEKQRLRLAQFQARPLSSFVRNRLIDEVYLPLVGDNLAKQIGAAGQANRADRMGLLLLISPPGYGKTTLLEYVADRLGLIFVRINCPALGHAVTSLDPSTAPNSAARQELDKLNLGLAMGNNVMLYLDDIQHTHPEFLQKFIGLADGTRRIEGVWNGEPRTYDLRGKRFAIAMAGNPYTESGEVFKIPDMLANRADIHNLGDVLSGRESLFSLSYLENCLTSHPVLLPLASRDPVDVHRLVRLAEGQEVAASDFSHPYSAVEIEELTGLLKRLFQVRDLLLKVNLAYIDSAARQDAYRTEPPFKLQGSYRNMTKLAGKVTALMRDDELDALLRDHYRGEAQTLTTGAEENLLKLAHLIGRPTPDEQQRWQAICAEFERRRKLGGDDSDAGTRITAGLLDVARAVGELKHGPAPNADTSEALRLAEAVLEMAVTYRQIIMPLVSATERRLDMDRSIRQEVDRVAERMEIRRRKRSDDGAA